MSSFKVCSLVCLFAFSLALAEVQKTEKDLIKEVYKECLEKDAVSCVKYQVYTQVDKVLEEKDKDTITVTEGVQIVKSEEPAGAPRALTSEDTAESALFAKFLNFVQSRSVKIDVSGRDLINTASGAARSISNSVEYLMGESDEETPEEFEEESRGKKKKLKKASKYLGPLFGILALKKVFMVKLLLVGVALLAGKALLVSKIALVLAAIIGLKKLFGSKGGHTEIVATPVHSVSHHDAHSYGGADLGAAYGGDAHSAWARNAEAAQNLAYKAYKPTQETQA